MGFSLKKVFKSAKKLVKNVTKGKLGGAIGAIVGTAVPGIGTGLGYSLGSLVDSGLSSSSSSAKKQAQWNNQQYLNMQTALNKQGYGHDVAMLQMQQAYDSQMANTAVQRRQADLKASGINPALAGTEEASGGGLGGGSGIGGGSANTDKIDALNYGLNLMASQRDADRVEIEQSNSASSAMLNDSMAQKNLAEMASIIQELPYISRKNEAQISNILADTVKSRAETAKSIADTQNIEEMTNKLRLGVLANIVGTKNTKQAAKYLGAGAALIPGVGIGAKLYKGAKTARGFAGFLKSVAR